MKIYIWREERDRYSEREREGGERGRERERDGRRDPEGVKG